MVASMAFATWSYTNKSAGDSIENVTQNYQESLLNFVTSKFTSYLEESGNSVQDTASLLELPGVGSKNLTSFETLRTEVSLSILGSTTFNWSLLKLFSNVPIVVVGCPLLVKTPRLRRCQVDMSDVCMKVQGERAV